MWPLDRPAGEVLKLPGKSAIPWAVFNPAWYRQTYPEVADRLDGRSPAYVLHYYLDMGQRQGHAPNRLFDEAWHREMYPSIAAGIAAGHFASAFDAYCRRGSLDRSAHWLFDELAYRERYPDVTGERLAARRLINGYDHSLRHGRLRDRIGHVLFDPALYLTQFEPSDIPAIRRQGAFQHYLERVERGAPEMRTSAYFDPAWYLQRYPDVAQAVAVGRWKSALHHYICNDKPIAFDPLSDFSETYYLERDPGLLPAIQSRQFRNGYQHFLAFGALELRSPAASVDLAWYAAQPTVRADLVAGRSANAFAHWLTLGRRNGPAAAAGLAAPAAKPKTPGFLDHLATALLPNAGRFGYCFDCTAEPLASVVMVVRDGFARTLATVASLRANVAGPLELIVVDRGSTDETQAIGRYLAGVKSLRFDSDVGWAQAANAGSQLATGAAVLFLAAEAQLAPGAVDRACARLNSDPMIGAVCGMVIQPSGVIGQAGGIVWNDTTTQDYMRGMSPLSPEANFVRDVDYGSLAFLLMPRDLLVRLDGFDPECAATGYVGVDLCTRIILAERRVVYDPSVVLFHDDRGQASRGSADSFRQKHAIYLAGRFSPGQPAQVFARHASGVKRRILFIEDTVPLRRIGSGFVRSNDVIRVMAGLGYGVTVYPVNGCTHDPAQVYGDMPDQVEVMHDHAIDRLPAFLAGRQGYYDIIWIARAHNLDKVRPHLSDLVSDETCCRLIVLDTEAVVPLRQSEQARLLGQVYDLEAGLQAALANTDICDAVLATTEDEAAVLRAHGCRQVSVLGHTVEPRPTCNPHEARRGVLFVGAIHTADSPNLDSLIWFVDEVLPLIEATLSWETRLTIAGYVAPGIDLERFEHHPRITLRGAVADLDPLYNQHRVFVAPTRYAAGTPYKVCEAASRGLPVVATNLLCRALGWTGRKEILSADADDPKAFAAATISLYRNEALWRRVRRGALRRLQRDNGLADYNTAVAGILSTSPRVS